MTWPFDDDNSALPVRDGFDVGGGQERTMAWGIGGYSGIRHAEERNFDGSITTLDTRGGRPIFETTYRQQGPLVPPDVDYVRGFVAWAGTRAVLFDPYTLTELDTNYLLAGKLYTVQDFETPWNVPISDTTDWHDVALIDNTKVRINGKWMEDLLTTTSETPKTIPYIINRGLTLDQYGDAVRNANEKRVFPVGRYHVESFAGGGLIETLTPSDVRSLNRAMTIGQRIDWTSDKAWLGQLYFTGTSWDAVAGTWAFSQREVDMMLTGPYLSGTNTSATVDLTPATLGASVPTSGSFSDPITLPSTPIGLLSDAPVLGQYGSFPTYLNPLYYVHWPWNKTLNSELAGVEDGTFTGEDRIGGASDAAVQAGRTLTYTASNTKSWQTRSVTTRSSLQTIAFAPTETSWTDVVLSWGDGPIWSVPAPSTPNRGISEKYLYESIISSSGATKVVETQTGAFLVEIPAAALVDLEFTQTKISGTTAVITPNLTFYDDQMGVINHIQQSVGFRPYAIPTTPPPAHDTVNAEFAAMQAAWATQYVTGTESGQHTMYYASISPISEGAATLTWSTRDYLLYDETNGVFIWLAGEFSGSQSAAGNGTATLTVTLHIETRHHTVVKQLAVINATSLDLLPEKDIGGGKFAVPSPQIRAIFAPLYQEQGSFKGAHYVELSEESNGADPAHLFNFSLALKTYAALGTLNSNNDDQPHVEFIPCNLLEMLYGFWFSTEYGVYSGARYPVNYTTRYNEVITALFTTPVRVSVRDGAETNWSDTFGTDFSTIDTVSLHRT